MGDKGQVLMFAGSVQHKHAWQDELQSGSHNCAS